jgi:hypothetical protein
MIWLQREIWVKGLMRKDPHRFSLFCQSGHLVNRLNAVIP